MMIDVLLVLLLLLLLVCSYLFGALRKRVCVCVCFLREQFWPWLAWMVTQLDLAPSFAWFEALSSLPQDCQIAFRLEDPLITTYCFPYNHSNWLFLISNNS
jgi:hypothetical protein